MSAILSLLCHYLYVHRETFLGIYSGLGFAQALFILLASFALAIAGIFASRKMHNEMLSSILRSPMVFFDTTPLGRILNRFSKDIYTIDMVIPLSLRIFILTLFAVVSTIIVILIATPIFAVVIFPLGLFYTFIQVTHIVFSTNFTVRYLQFKISCLPCIHA